MATQDCRSPVAQARLIAKSGVSPKARTSSPASTVEEVIAPDYSKPLTNSENSASPSVVSNPSSESSSQPQTPTPPSEPSKTDSTPEDDGVKEEDRFQLSADDYLYDKETNTYLFKDADGKWYGAYGDPAFSMHLLGMGLPKKNQEGFKSGIAQFHRREKVYNSRKILETVKGVTVFNTYKPSILIPSAGLCDDILALCMNLVGNDKGGYEYFLDWTALPLQSVVFKGEPFKMGTSIVSHGTPGGGKSTFATIMGLLYGPDNVVTIGQNALDSHFNGELVERLFVIANEVMSSTNRSTETANKIKPWVTDLVIPLERKFEGAKEYKNTFNIMFTSNDFRPVIIDKDDRRYTVFKSNVFDKAISKRIHDDLAGDKKGVSAFYKLLLDRKVQIGYGDLYRTQARLDMIAASLPSDERFVTAIMEDGWLAVSYPWVQAAPNGQSREAVEADKAVLSSVILEVYQDYCRRHALKPRGQMHVVGTLLEKIKDAYRSVTTVATNTRLRSVKGIPMVAPDAPVIAIVPPPLPVVESAPLNVDDNPNYSAT